MLKGLLKGHSLLKDRSKKKKLTSGNVLEKVALLERKIAPALKYGVCYADTYPVLEPVGVPSTFINKTYLAHENLMKEETQIWWRPDLDWEQLLANDPAPVPDVPNREGYFTGPNANLEYWLSGYIDYQKTIAAAEMYGIGGGKFFDFGGSTGRVFRHFAFQDKKWDVWSSDFKISSVKWNLQHFPTAIKTFLNNSNPSLPLPDAYFDLVAAFSVFTHINETETSWLLELRRILKVGGVAYLTIHDENTWREPVPPLRDTVVKFRPDIAMLPELPVGKTVATFREDDPYNCNVFHSREYIRDVWGRFFEICEMKPLHHFKQCVVVCRRPN